MSDRAALLHRLQPTVAAIALTLLSIPVLQPLTSAELTCGYDNVLHLWRAVEADALLQTGIVYARWQPHMALGLGYPLHTFQSPASALVVALIHRAGLAWAPAVNATFAAGVLLTALATWLLVREWYGDLAGVIAGVAITTMPFHAYVMFYRGSMSEALAWAFPPLILWGLIRWQTYAQRRGLVAAAGGLAALLWTHDASAYLFMPMMVLACLALALANRSRQMLWRGLVALGLGLGLAACFWIPSLLERGYVQFDRVTEYPYAASFVALDYLLEPPRGVDTTLVNPWLPKGIGLLPAMLGLSAIGAWWRARREARFWLGCIGLVTLGCIWLSLPYADPIWRLIPALRYLHFPWRFLAPAVLGVAVLIGAGAHWLLSTVPRATLVALPPTTAVLCLGALGWLYPPHCTPPQPASLGGMLAYEHQTGQWGTTTFGELTPRWVNTLPRDSALEAAVVAGREPARLRPEALPAGAHILWEEYGLHEATIELESPVTSPVNYQALYYPGWRVTVDGDRVPVRPSTDGLLAFALPAGRHTVHVHFVETPLRLVADALSLASLGALGVGLWVTRRINDRSQTDQPMKHDNRPSHTIWLLLGVAILIPALKLGVIDRIDNPLRRPNLVEGRLVNVDVPAQVTFGDEFLLLGHDVLPESVASGARFEVRTYWRASHPGGPNYGVTVHVVDEEGRRWDDLDVRPPRWHRTPPPVGEWPADQYALIALSIPLQLGTPPGLYNVELVAFDRATLAPLTAHDADRRALGPQLTIGQIRVTRPGTPPRLETLAIECRLDAPLGPLTLLDAHLDRAVAAPGDSALFSVLWLAQESQADDLSLRVTLIAADGSTAVEYALLPTAASHPTSVWLAGDVWRGQHTVRLPARLESGTYQWALQLCEEKTQSCWPSDSGVDFATLRIEAPDRQWTVPPLDISTDALLSGVVTLLGANLEPASAQLGPGSTLTVILAWRAEQDMDRSYRVFLHLLGAGGDPIAQSDGEPVNWTRPTTGWLPGEIVLDEHTLTIPEDSAGGEYLLQAGMYTLEDGRLTTVDDSDAVLLRIVIVKGET